MAKPRRDGNLADLFVVVLLILVVAALTGGCGRAHPCEPKAPAAPDTTGVLRLSGRFATFCHACPVAHKPTTMEPWSQAALTAAHCIDLRPFDAEIPLYSAQWSDGDGHSGLAFALGVNDYRDLGLLVPNGGTEFPHVYPLAKLAPQVGERVWMLGYDFRDKKRTAADRLFTGTVARLVANHIVMSEDSMPGSSGGCVLNDQGEVVGIVEAWLGNEAPGDSRSGYAVGVWGDLVNQTIKDPRPKKEPPAAGMTVIHDLMDVLRDEGQEPR